LISVTIKVTLLLTVSQSVSQSISQTKNHDQILAVVKTVAVLMSWGVFPAVIDLGSSKWHLIIRLVPLRKHPSPLQRSVG